MSDFLPIAQSLTVATMAGGEGQANSEPKGEERELLHRLLDGAVAP
jgi:hypothetical protein